MAPLDVVSFSDKLAALSKRNSHEAMESSIHAVLHNLSKRDNPNNRFPTVAIVLVALVCIMLLFGGFKLYSDARKRRETVV
jgi:type VI protein secretion system component VasF